MYDIEAFSAQGAVEAQSAPQGGEPNNLAQPH
jgi:hypothetical protein